VTRPADAPDLNGRDRYSCPVVAPAEPESPDALTRSRGRRRTLRTFEDPFTGQVYRRIKHFSGYHVILDVDCEAGSDPSCPDGDAFLQAGRAAGHTRASGYITTTGFDGIDHD
jgi:hypothetical protein